MRDSPRCRGEGPAPGFSSQQTGREYVSMEPHAWGGEGWSSALHAPSPCRQADQYAAVQCMQT